MADQENGDAKPAESSNKAVEIEGGGSVDDGTVKLKINGVDVGPLTHIDRTLAVTSEQINKAKTLIYVTSAITGLVLVVSILFTSLCLCSFRRKLMNSIECCWQ